MIVGLPRRIVHYGPDDRDELGRSRFVPLLRKALRPYVGMPFIARVWADGMSPTLDGAFDDFSQLGSAVQTMLGAGRRAEIHVEAEVLDRDDALAVYGTWSAGVSNTRMVFTTPDHGVGDVMQIEWLQTRLKPWVSFSVTAYGPAVSLIAFGRPCVAGDGNALPFGSFVLVSGKADVVVARMMKDAKLIGTRTSGSLVVREV